MEIIAQLLFIFELALLFVHEMDAIRRQEWKMFILLKDMPDEKAYRIFTLLHIPLYMGVLLLLSSGYAFIGVYITDIFLLLHLLVHVVFRRHPANQMNGHFSKCIIYSAGIAAIVHMVLLRVAA